MSIHAYDGKFTECSKIYLACKQYKNGTQAKSPKANIKPKPSSMISIVVKMAS